MNVIQMVIYALRCNVDSNLQVLKIQLVQSLCRSMLFVLHLLKRNFENLCDVDFYGIVHREFTPRDTHPVTPNSNTLSCDLFVHSVTHISLAKRLIVTKTRKAVFVSEQTFNCLSQKYSVAILVNSNRKITGNIYRICCFKYEIRQVVGNVLVVLINTRYLIIMGIYEQQICNKKLCRFIIENTRLNVCLIIG